MFNWTTLDRSTLINILWLSKNDIVGHSLTPSEFSKRIRVHLKLFQIPINVRSQYRKETTINMVWVGGVYRPHLDQLGTLPITLRFQFNTAQQNICITKSKFFKICFAVADTILHEIIHVRQYRRRNFKVLPGYSSISSSKKQRSEQEYLGHNDEIDAYAFNIACAMRDKLDNSDQKVIEYLCHPEMSRRLNFSSYQMYLKIFNNDHTHSVIKKLKRKIIYYLPYAAIGKPYLTSKWLNQY